MSSLELKSLISNTYKGSLTRKEFLSRADKFKGFWWQYWPHSQEFNRNLWIKEKRKKGTLITCSIDPGVVHLGIRIEKKDKYGTSFIIYELKQFFNDKKSKNREKVTLIEIMNYIDSIKDILSLCDLILIERQLGLNRDAEPVMFSLLSYFIILLKNNDLKSIICLVSPKLKSKVFCDLTGLKTKKLKLETVKVTKKIFKKRKEKSSLKIIRQAEREAKADDVADPVVMIESFLIVAWIGVLLLYKEFNSN